MISIFGPVLFCLVFDKFDRYLLPLLTIVLFFCRVFFHFVGATPGSTDLAFFLQRLSREINVSKVKRPFGDFPFIGIKKCCWQLINHQIDLIG